MKPPLFSRCTISTKEHLKLWFFGGVLLVLGLCVGAAVLLANGRSANANTAAVVPQVEGKETATSAVLSAGVSTTPIPTSPPQNVEVTVEVLPLTSDPIIDEAAVITDPTPSLPPPPPITQPLRNDQTVWFARDDALWRSDMDGKVVAQLSDSGFLGWDREEADFRDVRPRLSSDGRFAAQLTNTTSTRLLDLGTGQEVTIPAAWEIAWSPDGRTLAYAPLTGEQSLWLADAVTGSTWELVSSDQLSGGGGIDNIVWSADGSQVAFDCCFRAREPYDGFSDGRLQIAHVAAGDLIDVGETWSGIASGPPDFCWTNESSITIEPTADMSPCSLNNSYAYHSVTSLHNWTAQWEAIFAEDGAWESTRIFVTDGVDGPLLWEQTLPLQSYVVMAWSVDGRYLFFDDQAGDSPIWRINDDGTGLIELLPDAMLLGMVPQWSLVESE